MGQLLEVRTPEQVLNFAVNRERGQVNQQEIIRAHSSKSKWSQVSYIKIEPGPTSSTEQTEPCYKCGQP